MDKEDGLYLFASCLIAVGCGLAHSVGAGLIAAGGMLAAWPFVARILSRGADK